MSLQTLTNLLAEGDWRQLLGPLVLLGFYAVAAIIKAAGNRVGKAAGDDDEGEEELPVETDVPQKTRYKPLHDTAQSPQSRRTLPYARTAQGAPAAPPQAARPAGEAIDWDRQQEIKRRQLEQAEALRRQQALERQRQQLLRQAAIQEQREKLQRQQAGRPAAVVSRIVQSAAASSQRPAVVQPPVKAVRVSPPTAAKKAVPERTDKIGGLLRKRDSLRAAMVLKEILDKPLAMR